MHISSVQIIDGQLVGEIVVSQIGEPIVKIVYQKDKLDALFIREENDYYTIVMVPRTTFSDKISIISGGDFKNFNYIVRRTDNDMIIKKYQNGITEEYSTDGLRTKMYYKNNYIYFSDNEILLKDILSPKEREIHLYLPEFDAYPSISISLIQDKDGKIKTFEMMRLERENNVMKERIAESTEVKHPTIAEYKDNKVMMKKIISDSVHYACNLSKGGWKDLKKKFENTFTEIRYEYVNNYVHQSDPPGLEGRTISEKFWKLTHMLNGFSDNFDMNIIENLFIYSLYDIVERNHSVIPTIDKFLIEIRQ